MCEHGDTVDLRVYVHPRVAYLGVGRWDRKPIDRCIAPIVEALQARGIDMLGSCCGHGKGPGSILLADGRTLTVAPTQRDSTHLRDSHREPANTPHIGGRNARAATADADQRSVDNDAHNASRKAGSP